MLRRLRKMSQSPTVFGDSCSLSDLGLLPLVRSTEAAALDWTSWHVGRRLRNLSLWGSVRPWLIRLRVSLGRRSNRFGDCENLDSQSPGGDRQHLAASRTRNWLQRSEVRNGGSGASIAVGRFLCWSWPARGPGGELALWVGGELAISTPLFGSAGCRGMRFRPGREDGVSSIGLNSPRKSIESARREPLIEPGRAAKPLSRKPCICARCDPPNIHRLAALSCTPRTSAA